MSMVFLSMSKMQLQPNDLLHFFLSDPECAGN